jgi:hypothetical protein
LIESCFFFGWIPNGAARKTPRPDMSGFRFLIHAQKIDFSWSCSSVFKVPHLDSFVKGCWNQACQSEHGGGPDPVGIRQRRGMQAPRSCRLSEKV